MRKSIKTIGLFLFILVGQFCFGQNTNEKLNEAIKLMDSGKVDESIALLEDCRKLEPDRFDYPYEMAYAYHFSRCLRAHAVSSGYLRETRRGKSGAGYYIRQTASC